MSWNDDHNKFSEHLSSYIDTEWKKNVFFLVMRTQDLLYWQLSHVYSSLNYSNHAVYYINSNYLFYNWKFVPFDHLHLILPIPIPASSHHKSDLFFCVYVCFWSIINLEHYANSCYTI